MMYLSCTDTEITKRQAATEKRCRDMIAEYLRKPWWRKIGRETEVRGMIIAEWSAFSKWMDDRIAFMRKSNASVSSSGGEPGYAPGGCSAGTLECVIDAIVRHDEEHPDHGVGCSCMDRHAGAIRRLISARMLKVPGRKKSLRNLTRALGYIVNNP